MRLVIGGACQGKLKLVQRRYGFSETATAEGGRDGLEQLYVSPVIHNFQLCVRKWMKEGEQPFVLLEQLLRSNPEVVIICDEVGSGLVPVDRFERDYRETVGRICCELVDRAETVERVFCGIPVLLKGMREN